MVRLWWLLWPKPTRLPPQRWHQTAELSEAPIGVAPPQPDTTWCGCGGCTIVRPPPRWWREIRRFIGSTVAVVAIMPSTARHDGGSGRKSRCYCCCGGCGGVSGGGVVSQLRVEEDHHEEKLNEKRKINNFTLKLGITPSKEKSTIKESEGDDESKT
uniref:Uncharacterized protein n=1 Tax=Tanacetum cinerariifolium TaxID=118510 RepID=A0A6L2L758_TANCI|nr:hypothetical protein [Tanacetum cinerariifolium]